jgi:diguanylate cyclase (GGDEF)-like protein/PAS domain S-box-containing protein
VDRARLRASLVDDAFEWMVVFDPTGEIVFANQASLAITGWDPEGLVGTNILDLAHPDDLERAHRTITISAEYGPPKGTTSFRVRHAAGTWVELDVTAGLVTDGRRELFGAYGRPTDYQNAVDQVLLGLLGTGPVHEALRPVCDVFSWQHTGTRVAITWTDPDGDRDFVSTEIERGLSGADAPATSPWGVARATGVGVHHGDLSQLDPATRQLAEAAGLWAYWIEPVVVADGGESALVTVWAGAGGPPPENHSLGVDLAVNFVDLVLRWTQQLRRLEQAARVDELTGLANRKELFERLDSEPGGGALLYCDLDRFKPVNDALGHAAGDELLRAVADRLRAGLRPDDLVARVGVDEFVELCRGADAAAADQLADRIRGALAEPFAVAGTTVTIGISIGIGVGADHVGVDLLDAADRALYRAKAAR